MVDTAPDPVSVTTPLPDHAVVPAVWGRITNLDVDRGEGSWLIARDGTRYLDYSSGIGVTNTGHAHPRVAAAIAAQASKLLHGQQNILYHEPGLRLYERLRHVLPGGPWQAFLSNSGAEAVEASVKLARVATGRPVILAFRGGFHGRTAQTMALTTAKDTYRAAFEPLPGSVYHTPLPVLLSGGGRAARSAGLHLRLGGAARPAVPPDRRSVEGRRDHRRAGPWRGRLRRLAAVVPAAPPRDHPRSTASCSSPTRSRTGFGGPAGCSLSSTGTSSRHPGHGQGHRLGAAAVGDPRPDRAGGAPGAREATAARTAGTSSRAPRRMRRSTSSRTRAGRQRRRRGAQLLGGLRTRALHPAMGDVAGPAAWSRWSWSSPGAGDGGVPDAELTRRVLGEASRCDRLMRPARPGPYGERRPRIIPPLVTTSRRGSDRALGILDESLTAAGA